MPKTRKWFILSALVALGSPAAGDATGGALPSQPCPALAAAPVVYAFVLAPLGSRTWAERQLQEIRASVRTEAREDLGSQARFILLALHERSTQAYALEMMEAPREPAAPAAVEPGPSVLTFAEPALQGAFDAMGLTPADLLGAPDVSPAALTLAGALLRLIDCFDRGSDLRGVPTLCIDPGERERRPQHLRYQPSSPQPEQPRLTFSKKKIVRSLYKILIGTAISVLVWGFVRNATY